jgi:DNA-binding PadR family transcriptional regulator
MATDPVKRSPLALVVLASLAERPMHAYKMFQLMQQREKGSLVNLAQRNSLYQVINRLERAGLAEIDSTERADNRPERTVYRITDAGTATVRDWLRDMLTAERPEFPEFPAALSLLSLLAPAEVTDALASRLEQLAAERDGFVASIARADAMQLPRLFVLDEDYRRAMLDAQIAWVESVMSDLRSGGLTWSAEWIAQIAAQFEQDE